jgi:hypothetical protein
MSLINIILLILGGILVLYIAVRVGTKAVLDGVDNFFKSKHDDIKNKKQ